MENARKQAAALKYVHGEDRAPKVVAKGGGSVADRIIEIARENNIPIKEDKVLIELLSSLELYQEIPPELYKAVAEILAFVYALNLRVNDEKKRLQSIS